MTQWQKKIMARFLSEFSRKRAIYCKKHNYVMLFYY